MRPVLALVFWSVLLLAPVDVRGQEARRISVAWTEAPITDVLHAFATFSGRSIVAGAGVEGTFVTADINDQPWDVALDAVLRSRGLRAEEDEHGIILVESLTGLDTNEAVAPIVTRAYRASYVRADELQAVIASLLSARGSVSVLQSTNTVIVSDTERVHRAVAGLLGNQWTVTGER